MSYKMHELHIKLDISKSLLSFRIQKAINFLPYINIYINIQRHFSGSRSKVAPFLKQEKILSGKFLRPL